MTVSTLLLIGSGAGRATLILYSIYVGHACQKLTASETFLLFSLGCHSDFHTFDHSELGSEKKKRNLLAESQRRNPEVLILVL